MSTPAATPETPTVDLKNRWLAAGLALLLPGLGHLYQGRIFKAAIYSVCILGLFFTGQALATPKPFAEAEAEAMPIYDPEPNTRCEGDSPPACDQRCYQC